MFKNEISAKSSRSSVYAAWVCGGEAVSQSSERTKQTLELT